MLGFLIKKTFFDMWDNLLTLVMINLGFILVLAVVIYLPYLLNYTPILSLIGLCVGLIIFNIYAGGVSLLVGDMADYKSVSFSDFFRYIHETWKASLTLGGITAAQVVILSIAFPFYMSVGGVVGLAAMSLIFWVSIIWWLASQYFFPVRQRLDREVGKILKKSLLLFFDNTGFTVFMGLGTLFILGVSTFTAFLLPGFAAILLWHQIGLRLRLYKYDYIEAHPESDRKRIPWSTLLMDDQERVGPRSLKGMIFPWKE